MSTDKSREYNTYFKSIGKWFQRTTALLVDNNGDSIINDRGQAKVVLDGRVDDDNSSSTPLLSDATFIGVSEETLDYAMVFITVFSDVASATNGLCIEISSDNITWRDGDCYTIAANTEKTFSFQPNKKYYRVKYVNGSTDQTTFDLHTILKKTNSKPSSHRISETISPEDDATLQKSVLTALSDTGLFTNITATKSGNLKVANVEDGLSIAKGDVAGTTYVHKFGAAPDFDSSDGSVTVWDGADDSDVAVMQYIYSTTAAIDSISSSNNADVQEMLVQGLDGDYNLVTQATTLTGQTRAILATPLLRVFRMKNNNAVDNVGRIYAYENTALSGGVPIDTTKIRSIIQPLNNQTLMAVYTVPAGKIAYMRSWYASTAGANKSSNYVIELRAREEGKVFQLKHVVSIEDGGTSYLKHDYTDPQAFGEKVDIEMRAKILVNTTEASISAGFDIVLVDN